MKKRYTFTATITIATDERARDDAAVWELLADEIGSLTVWVADDEGDEVPYQVEGVDLADT